MNKVFNDLIEKLLDLEAEFSVDVNCPESRGKFKGLIEANRQAIEEIKKVKEKVSCKNYNSTCEEEGGYCEDILENNCPCEKFYCSEWEEKE